MRVSTNPRKALHPTNKTLINMVTIHSSQQAPLLIGKVVMIEFSHVAMTISGTQRVRLIAFYWMRDINMSVRLAVIFSDREAAIVQSYEYNRII
jgi:hypothetical protein